MSVVWIEESVVLALHEEHLAEHGGPVGIRVAAYWSSHCFVMATAQYITLLSPYRTVLTELQHSVLESSHLQSLR